VKRALIIHGFTETPSQYWYAEEVKFLESLGYEATAPQMPHRFTPLENSWLKVIEDFAPDEETVLIGHSLGGNIILEFLEKTGQRVDKLILAGTPIRHSEKLKIGDQNSFKLYREAIAIECLLDLCGYEEIYDWEKIKDSVNTVHLVYKKDDVLVPLDDGKILAQRLDGVLQILEGHDHVNYVEMNVLNKGLL